jgi:hypothetical protein
MLFELSNDYNSLKPLKYLDIGEICKKEKDLEDLLAKHLQGTLFEGNRLLPFHQERNRQKEADIYALNQEGDLVIFELKRGVAGAGALEQLFRYTQLAGEWSYEEIEQKFAKYPTRQQTETDLQKAHKEAFDLSVALKKEEFNRHQHMKIVGSAVDEELMRAVEFWKQKGLWVDFLPYRVYRIGEKQYFEFFAKPYDMHANPAKRKGVLFDTNRSWNEDSIWEMMEKKRVSAYGVRMQEVDRLSHNDIIFYSHPGYGIVAAAKISGMHVSEDTKNEERYWNVEFLTPVPERSKEINKFMPFDQVKKVMGRKFWWAATVKVPYLTYEEAEHLLDELKKVLQV